MAKNKTKSRPRGNKVGVVTGDFPRRVPATYNTMSCRIPRVNGSFLFRNTTDAIVVASNSADVAGSYYFYAGSLPNTSSLGALFDQYRIVAVRITISPQQNAVGLFTNSTTSIPTFLNVIDYDDNVALSSANAARSYDTCIEMTAGQSCERIFRPRPQMGVNNATGVAGGVAEAPANVWIDMASQNVNHYGIKYYIPQATAAQTQLPSWLIVAELFVEFRCTR